MVVPDLKGNGFKIKVDNAAVAGLTAVITMVVSGLRQWGTENLKERGAIAMRGRILIG